MQSYEQLLALVSSIDPPNEAGQRDIGWATAKRIVGFARTSDGRIEIFLVGAPLESATRTVRDALEYGPWWHHDSGWPAFSASRLLLPSAGHFSQVAAFIAAELLTNGADVDLAAAFRATEAIIELAIQRLRLSDEALTGLIGELLILDALTQRVNAGNLQSVVQSWDGWRPSQRDFALGSVGVEVKTTTRATSTHPVQGTHQLEPNDGETGGHSETKLMLVSIGIQHCEPHGNSYSLPSLVQRISDRLTSSGHADTAVVFESHVREYGSGVGYEHSTMAVDPAFSRAVEVTFVRSYDMSDENLRVLRREDVAQRSHVDASSLRFVVDLPSTLSGSMNPILGLNGIANSLLGETGALE